MAILGQDITQAIHELKQGNLVAIPTETVYGLAANALNNEAVIKIFEVKNRPYFDPLIIHTDSIEKIKEWVEEIPLPLKQLATAFWPGPLTLLLPKKRVIPDIVTSGLNHVAVRIPNHKTTLELLSQLDFPLAAPSANPFGYISPTEATHVQRQLGDKIPYILDGGACLVGIESTIIGLSDEGSVCVYRLGGLSLEDIEQVVGKVELNTNQSSDPKAPGQLKSHYAPRKPLFIGDLTQLEEKFKEKQIGILSFGKYIPVNSNNQVFSLSEQMSYKEAAIHLFSLLRQLDESNVDVIITTLLPEVDLGRAINDRLKRAAYKE